MDGLSCDSLCIGDVLHVYGPDGQRRGELQLQVSQPRRPCAEVDKKHGRIYSQQGVRAECARTGLAGWLCRVLTPGEIGSGDSLRLVRRVHPQWSLRTVSHLLYSEAEDSAYTIAAWPGTPAQVRRSRIIGRRCRREPHLF